MQKMQAESLADLVRMSERLKSLPAQTISSHLRLTEDSNLAAASPLIIEAR
jgi:hypothetical protein